MQYLAFDLGMSHTGVAASYEANLVEGLTTIHSQPDRLISQILHLIHLHKPKNIVLGVPPNGPILKLANDIKLELETSIKIPVFLVDEHKSSQRAQKLLTQSGYSVSKRKAKDHATAACVLLQQYLDDLA